jgi:hypothetical protein
MNKIKLEVDKVVQVAIHLAALEVALVDSQASKGSTTNSDKDKDNKEEPEVRHLEIYLTSLKSFSVDSKVEIDNEEVQVEQHPEVRISSSNSKSISWKL